MVLSFNLSDITFKVHKGRLKGSFEDDLYSDMLNDSFKFLTEPWKKDGHFLDFKASIWTYDEVSGFFSGSLIIQSE